MIFRKQRFLPTGHRLERLNPTIATFRMSTARASGFDSKNIETSQLMKDEVLPFMSMHEETDPTPNNEQSVSILRPTALHDCQYLLNH
ncbi:hypothetical protein FS842_004452 [Serendipita sp. 407]|nr:hypothetical protein FRC15_006794 [Serendipita sp. 397]KAG9030236.1 hypothetical protein FS842_004452 [Serendipita sp. 407]